MPVSARPVESQPQSNPGGSRGPDGSRCPAVGEVQCQCHPSQCHPSQCHPSQCHPSQRSPSPGAIPAAAEVQRPERSSSRSGPAAARAIPAAAEELPAEWPLLYSKCSNAHGGTKYPTMLPTHVRPQCLADILDSLWRHTGPEEKSPAATEAKPEVPSGSRSPQRQQRPSQKSPAAAEVPATSVSRPEEAATEVFPGNLSTGQTETPVRQQPYSNAHGGNQVSYKYNCNQCPRRQHAHSAASINLQMSAGSTEKLHKSSLRQTSVQQFQPMPTEAPSIL